MGNFRRLTGLVVVMMVATLLPVGSSAGQPTPQIILQGDGPSYVDVVIRETITPGSGNIEVTTTGSYAGYVITQRLGELVALVGGSVAVPKFDRLTRATGQPAVGPLGFAGGELEPGTYRFQLISDGSATVRIPAEGLSRSMTLRTTKEAKAQSNLASLGSGPGDLDDRWPVRRTRATVTLLSFLQIVDTHQASATQQCLKEGSENFDPCDQTEDYGWTGAVTSPGSVGEGWVYSFAGFYQGYAVGEYTAAQHVTQAAAASDNFAFYLNVPLTAPGADNMGPPAPKETFSFPYQFAGVQDQEVCALYVAVWVGSCGFIPARPSDREARVKIVDATGAPTAATVVVGDQKLEICGETTKPLKVPPYGGVYVNVHAHPTLDCPDALGTTGTVEVTLGP